MVAKKETAVEKFADKAQIASMDDAFAFLREQGYEIQSAREVESALGDGYTYLADKNQLVNIPFVIVDYRGGYSDNYSSPMVSVWAMTATDRRVKFIDMGTGIAQQLLGAAERGFKPQGMVFEKGLVASNYEFEKDDGTKGKATTFYLGV